MQERGDSRQPTNNQQNNQSQQNSQQNGQKQGGSLFQRVDSSGIELGNESLPRVVALPSSEGLRDTAPIEKELGNNVEKFNEGIQGHLYTKPEDAFVLRAPSTPVAGGQQAENSQAEDLQLRKCLLERKYLLTGLLANADIYRNQTGLELVHGEQGEVVFVNPDELFVDAMSRAHQLGGRNPLLGMVTPNSLQAYGYGNDPSLQQIAQVVTRLDSKSESSQLLKRIEVLIPKSYSFVTANLSKKALQKALREVDEKYNYVIKADGSAGGFGVYTNQSKGYSKDGLEGVLPLLLAEGKLGGSFQLQQFIEGQPVGSIAVFDGNGGFTVVSFHKAIEKHGKYQGTYWEMAYEDKFRDQAVDIFAKMAGCEDLAGLVGPIGFDAIVDKRDGRLYVIEVNPRVTGATPIPYLRERLDVIKAVQGENFDIRSAYLDINISFAQKFFEDPQLLMRCINDVRKKVREDFNDRQALILPQGLSPAGKSKVLIVNDTENGDVRNLLIERIQEENNG